MPALPFTVQLPREFEEDPLIIRQLERLVSPGGEDQVIPAGFAGGQLILAQPEGFPQEPLEAHPVNSRANATPDGKT